jgi:hypothetical protein
LWQFRHDWTSRETLTGFAIADLPQRELALQQSNATFGGPTQARSDMIDLAKQIPTSDEGL